jgi:hypothetical protein
MQAILRNRIFRFGAFLLLNLAVFGWLLFNPEPVAKLAEALHPLGGSDTCTAPTQIIGTFPYNDTGTTVSATDDYNLPSDTADPTCTAPVNWAQGAGVAGSLPRGSIYTGTGTAPDVAYSLTTDKTCRLQVDMDPTGAQDLALIVYLAQCTSNLGDCVVVDDNGIGGVAEMVQWEATAGSTYYILVDGYSTGGTPPGPSGPYTLAVSEITSPATGCYAVGAMSAPEIAVAQNGTDIPDGTGSLNFGSTPVGVPVDKTFTVSNSGDADLTLVEPVSLPAGFSLVNTFGSTTVTPGNSTTFTVRLTAAAAGSYSGELSFGNNDSNENPFNFTISGTVPAPEIAVSENATDIPDGTGSLDFGSTPAGAPVDKTFTVFNSGGADLTLVEPVSLPAGFSLVNTFGSTTITPGNSTTFTVRLTAASAGSFSGTLSFGNNDGDENPFDFTISGTVTAPEIAVSENSVDIPDGTGSLDFGATFIGVPVDKTFTVANTGAADLTLVEPVSLPAGFSLVNSFGSTTVTPGNSTTFTARLDAAGVGNYSGEVSFGNNDGDENPFNFTISGTVTLHYYYFPLFAK